MTTMVFPSCPILLVDDEPQALQSFDIALRSGGITNIVSCQDGHKALSVMSKLEVETVLLDLWMPRMSGEEVLSLIRHERPDIPVVIVTGLNEVDTAVRCMRQGAFDYLVKPIEKERLVTTVMRAIEFRDLRRENLRLTQGLLSTELARPEAFSAIVTQNAEMKALFQYLEAVAGSSQPVLVTGETGTGKELVAKSVHALSRRKGPFVAVNVAGLDDAMFADTLFGHKKGAFTGAIEARAGMIEQASGGTLFLDEIGDLSVVSQTKLLRLLQERDYFPVGSDVARRTDARIIVATNQDVAALTESGKFRKDLYYRLSTHHANVPPLRRRIDDLSLLIEHFLAEAAVALGKRKPTTPKELPALLSAYAFPGNVRELRSMVFDAVSRHKSAMLSMDGFRDAIGLDAKSALRKSRPEAAQLSFADDLPTLKGAEDLLVIEALKRTRGNQAAAAALLGISRQALNKRLKLRKP
jgi:two-component system nitrogen regulation response regulator GlnG